MATKRTKLKWGTAQRAWTFSEDTQSAEVNAVSGLTWDEYALIEFISGAGANIKEIIDELPSEKKKRLIIDLSRQIISLNTELALHYNELKGRN